MICVSTRGKAPAVPFRDAVLSGLAPDGGLYVPAVLERQSDPWWDALRGRSFQDVAVAMAQALIGDEFAPGELTALVTAALDFPVSIVRLNDHLQVVELFHGPTFAFKDFGARMLARFMSHVHDGAEPLTVLVATSGDTGSAVAHAFFGVPGTQVVVLYPDGQVSEVQEAQFTTLGGNVSAVAIDGTFDDCQRLAKEAFANDGLKARVKLTSANSISLGRLIPQMFYYGYAAVQAEHRQSLTVSVPSGNFGNLAAGVMAWKMGAPLASFVAATTVNDTVPRYLETGRFEPRPSVPTLANAMDVGNPSNFERLQWLFGGDRDAMRRTIASSVHTDEDVRRAIGELYRRYGYVADPHTAIAYLGAQALKPSSPPAFAKATAGEQAAASLSAVAVLATAHPAKFREVVEPAIGKTVQLPAALAATLERPRFVERIGATLGELSKLL
jgi:threonine synthase